jgi:hypothetical protein
VQHGTTGQYWAEFVPTLAGPHAYVWTVLVGGKTIKFGPDVFNIRASTPGPLIGLDEARRHLRITSSDPARDEDIRDFVDTATELCEAYTGRTYRRMQVTGTFDGGGRLVRLVRTPVVSILSVTESAIAVPDSGWTLNADTGALYRGPSTGCGRWAWGRQNIVVTYTAGPVPAQVPALVRQAVKELLRHLWDTQRGGSNLPRQAGVGDDWDPRQGYSMPRRVTELLDTERVLLVR